MKKQLFTLSVLLCMVILTACSSSKMKAAEASDQPETFVTVSEDPEPTTIPSPEPTEEPKDEQESLRQAFKDNVCNGSATFYESVNNDVTGNWRELVYYGAENILDNIPEYYAAYYKDNNEIHIVVNLGLKTTAILNVLSDDIIDVSLHEYVDKEEHDAKKIGDGELYGQYWVHLDTGEVEKLED